MLQDSSCTYQLRVQLSKGHGKSPAAGRSATAMTVFIRHRTDVVLCAWSAWQFWFTGLFAGTCCTFHVVRLLLAYLVLVFTAAAQPTNRR